MNKKRKLLESSEGRGDFQERGAAFEGAPVEVLAPVGCSEVIPGPFLPVPPALIEGVQNTGSPLHEGFNLAQSMRNVSVRGRYSVQYTQCPGALCHASGCDSNPHFHCSIQCARLCGLPIWGHATPLWSWRRASMLGHAVPCENYAKKAVAANWSQRCLCWLLILGSVHCCIP